MNSCNGPLTFDEVAPSGGVFSISAIPPAINDAGLVAFTGSDASAVQHLLLGAGGPLTALDVSAWGLDRVGRLAIDDAGDVAFLAGTPTSGVLFGVFVTDLAGSSPATLYGTELGGGLSDGGLLRSFSRVALSANGLVAFSSIVDGHGALYRGPVTGSLEVVRTGSGAFFNNQELDVNAAGTIAMQMEHLACGLQRGVLLFDTPQPAIADIFKAIAGLNVGQQPDTALNDAGQVAIALTGSGSSISVVRCPAGEPVQQLDVPVGVYTANPTPLSDPPDLTLVAAPSGGFVSFGAVDVNNAGTVVFEATLGGGQRGIFRGPDAVADKIVAAGDTLGGELVTDVQLGQLNDSCQISIAIERPSGRSVWRVGGVAP
jgi:hypothetical protein